MPKRAEPLTALAVKNAKPGTHVDGGGLMLVVRGKAASWTMRYTFGGKRRDLGLGSAWGDGALSLAAARARAAKARAQLETGIDPVAAREAEAAGRKAEEAAKAAEVKAETETFQMAAEALHRVKAPSWKSPKHGAQWLATLKAHAFPVIGAKPVASVDGRDVLAVLLPLWATVPVTAARLRQRIEAVLAYAEACGMRLDGPNPAVLRGKLGTLLGAAPKVMRQAKQHQSGKGEHHPSLPWQDMPAFLGALEGRKGVSALAVRFAIVTCARTGEVRGMTWGEVDLDAGLWVVPGARMKAGKVHFVPLSSAALAVLADVKALAAGRDSLVFPGQREGRPLSDMALSMLVRGMATDGLAQGARPRWCDPEGRLAVPHGFRATFKAWSLAQGWPDHLSEKALAHTDANKARAAYAREPLTEERRPMMQAWADWCGKPIAAVIASLAAEKAKRMATA